MAPHTHVAILGATGYTGAELVRLLLDHPAVEIAALTSRQYAGQPYSAAFPQFTGRVEHECMELDAARIAKTVPFAFSCLPHGEAAATVAQLIDAGVKVVDLSADFRLKDKAAYEAAYGVAHPAPQLLTKAVYGLPELYRTKIAKAALVANPGCYPTGVILGLAPVVKKKLIGHGRIVADCKSGVSGAGRGLNPTTQFCEINEGMQPYAALAHRHNPEINQEVSALGGEPADVDFVPHLIPINRGLISTLYVMMKEDTSREKLLSLYKKFYAKEPYVVVRDDMPRVQDVVMTNYCHIGIAVKGKRAVIATAIDNLTKGASGQAVQNMNCMLGFDETAGL